MRLLGLFDVSVYKGPAWRRWSSGSSGTTNRGMTTCYQTLTGWGANPSSSRNAARSLLLGALKYAWCSRVRNIVAVSFAIKDNLNKICGEGYQWNGCHPIELKWAYFNTFCLRKITKITPAHKRTVLLIHLYVFWCNESESEACLALIPSKFWIPRSWKWRKIAVTLVKKKLGNFYIWPWMYSLCNFRDFCAICRCSSINYKFELSVAK